MKKKLGILFYKSIDLELGTYLIKKLQEIFKNKFTHYELIKESLDIPQKSYDKERDQYFASFLLEPLRSYAIDNDYYKILGIFPDVMYSKWLNFIFGQAEFGDEEETRASIISSIRLKIDCDFTKDGLSKYYKRVLKEAVHEIGHTLSLDHCDNTCVMKYSETLSDTDEKPYNYCSRCQELLKIR